MMLRIKLVSCTHALELFQYFVELSRVSCRVCPVVIVACCKVTKTQRALLWIDVYINGQYQEKSVSFFSFHSFFYSKSKCYTTKQNYSFSLDVKQVYQICMRRASPKKQSTLHYFLGLFKIFGPS